MEAQSENPEKPVEGIGKSKETEQTSMQETGEPPTTAENKTEGSFAELQIAKVLQIGLSRYCKTVESRFIK